MPRSAHRTVSRSLIGAVVCSAVGMIALAHPALTGRPLGRGTVLVLAVAWIWGLVLVGRAWMVTSSLGQGLERLRTAVLNLVADHRAILPAEARAGLPPEIDELLGSLTLYQGQLSRERMAPDRRMVAVLATLASGVVVVTEQGQVSLLNYPARELLGAERARVGTSIFAALERDSVLRAIARAREKDRVIEAVFERLDGVSLQGRVASLPDDEGAVVIFPPMELTMHRPDVEFDLELHDVPPATAPLHLDLPLDELPLLVMDTETTGLSVVTDRVVSVGAVSVHGSRIFRAHMLDDLVDPGVPIPPASTAIHGITDEMVAGARTFPAVYADLQRMARNRVVVGHNVAFDLTILRQECKRHDRPWDDLVFIDTMRLASLLNPALKDFSLEQVSRLYQIDLHGRHTALGDAMVTAELFVRMLPRLQQQGFGTLRQLLRFHCSEAVDVIAGQREQGWITGQPPALRLWDDA